VWCYSITNSSFSVALLHHNGVCVCVCVYMCVCVCVWRYSITNASFSVTPSQMPQSCLIQRAPALHTEHDATPSRVMCVTWLLQTCGMTQSQVWHDSFYACQPCTRHRTSDLRHPPQAWVMQHTWLNTSLFTGLMWGINELCRPAHAHAPHTHLWYPH